MTTTYTIATRLLKMLQLQKELPVLTVTPKVAAEARARSAAATRKDKKRRKLFLL